jgi:hypothetical protein
MRLVLAFILALGFGGTTGIAGTSVTNGSPVALRHAQITWAVPTNAWPQSLWSYKVVPQDFSPSVVSNLMALGSFTAKDRRETPRYFLANDEQTIFFGTNGVKFLAICPALGFIQYHNSASVAASQLQKVVAVPNQAETTGLGLSYLRRFGIDVSQLATKAGTSELDMHWERERISYVDQQTQKEIILTNKFGAIFARRVDGIKTHGYGGMEISFGNNAKVASVELCWRNLQPYELHDCPSAEQVTGWLRDGRITLHKLASLDPFTAATTKLTITNAVALYADNKQTRPLDYLWPYIQCEGSAVGSNENTTIWFECPLTLATENWKVVR